MKSLHHQVEKIQIGIRKLQFVVKNSVSSMNWKKNNRFLNKGLQPLDQCGKERLGRKILQTKGKNSQNMNWQGKYSHNINQQGEIFPEYKLAGGNIPRILTSRGKYFRNTNQQGEIFPEYKLVGGNIPEIKNSRGKYSQNINQQGEIFPEYKFSGGNIPRI